MKLYYIQRKSSMSSILWLLGCGLGMTHYPVKQVYAGYDLGNTIWLGRREEGFLCGDKSTHIDKLVSSFQNYVLKNPRHVFNIKKIFLNRSRKLVGLVKHLASFDYTEASNSQLYDDYKRVVDSYKEVYTYGEPLAIALGNFSDRIKKHFIPQGMTDADYEILLLPQELSFVQRERLDLLEIACLVKNGKVDKKIKQLLQSHVAKYTWLPYDYGVTSYKIDHFIKELKKLVNKGRRQILANYRHLANYSRNLQKQQNNIAAKYKFNNKQQSLIEIVRTTFYLVDYKKELFTQLHWYSERLFIEVSRRLKTPQHLVRYMLPYEVSMCLLKGVPVKKLQIQSRYNNCVITIKKSGRVNVIDGNKAKLIIDNFISSHKKGEKRDYLSGRVGNSGSARGLVRVIMDARKIDTFKHGEILVAPMTSPDYILAIRKAAAIVTDEGGTTCHAAIVSRELNIPCVIATKKATQVFKTGDMVEVDATRGIVRLLKSS
ncbi:MAG: PEP-utilizing enzyme [Patescibacteria group bacterium]